MVCRPIRRTRRVHLNHTKSQVTAIDEDLHTIPRRQQITQHILQRLRVIAACPYPAKPIDAKITVTLHVRFVVRIDAVVGLAVVTTLFEADAT